MTQEDMKREAQAQWDKWHRLQVQIKDIEYLITKGDEFRAQYQARLAELRIEEEAARIQFELLLKKMQK